MDLRCSRVFRRSIVGLVKNVGPVNPYHCCNNSLLVNINPLISSPLQHEPCPASIIYPYVEIRIILSNIHIHIHIHIRVVDTIERTKDVATFSNVTLSSPYVKCKQHICGIHNHRIFSKFVGTLGEIHVCVYTTVQEQLLYDYKVIYFVIFGKVH